MADFLEVMEKFVNNLNGAVTNMKGQVTLAENGTTPQLDTMKTPADYQVAGKFDSYLLRSLSMIPGNIPAIQKDKPFDIHF